MKIALIGYGRMGQAIEALALERGHSIVARISDENPEEVTNLASVGAEVAIEFTQPTAAVANLTSCMEQGVPVVSGTTGWLDRWSEVAEACQTHNGTFLYASNFSIGVNLFFKVNSFLARLMNPQAQYDVAIEEVHHTGKKDAPSGTAITLAQGIVEEVERKTRWAHPPESSPEAISITDIRQDPAPGTHKITYQSEIDTITIEHEAHSRQGFAVGALLAAEWLPGQTGIKTMDDFLKLG
ncbi:MAG TPA: 4-hydroxy-tetrahydrodipicolinate reductase [Cytophagales bacterium]|nr:4-hydroxy-tetrahydrodipicolinate reductase [Cytophagales bacterium]HAA17630.1 4-hydroxy-tetrahydrodipicolinate reductase [Cytophagales bacterium]HAP63953.1 4-hydroxy-tetrahydrodipicolinate reductase [Cytophagales bacterium]